MSRTFLLIYALITVAVRGQEYQQTPLIGPKGPPASCYNDFRQPQRCIPEFENAAYLVKMEATNTCGEYDNTTYCVQTSAGTTSRSCDVCVGQFSADYLTDLHHEQEQQTWWQSDTMKEGINHPNQVNLTLHLGKAYDITYVRVVFYSPRPQSFLIYKRVNENSEWVPYQYYSASCRDTYSLPESKFAELGAEVRPLCTSEYSDISPLSGGNVLFSTLEGRPSAYAFDNSPELQEWVTATDIRISLNRLNTFGDEIFSDSQVLQSYWYAIADVAVGARCKCNGHASRCEPDRDDPQRRRVCRCEHNTAGRDCEQCLDFYNDAPWGRASSTNVHVCKACNCNNFSNRCYFDKELYEKTGHGGHCIDCTENRDGANCERCKDNFYQGNDGVCMACNCDPTGSRSLQCNSEGTCQCKPGVTGDKCDACAPNFYEFTTQGCKPCDCNEDGSYGNSPRCDAVTGVCDCKDNVEGKRCRECKPGFFNLDLNNEFGCTPCFCYGHSSECFSAPEYSRVTLESQFIRSNEKWTAVDSQHQPTNLQYNANTQNIALSSRGNEVAYFVAPSRFLGDQRASYGHDLKFSLKLGEVNGYPLSSDVILEGGGDFITITIFGQNNPMPTNKMQDYSFRLHEDAQYGWTPTLATIKFQSILSNLTAIKIRGTFNKNGVGFLDNFRLETAQRGVAGYPALWVEMCSCPEGYVGQFCESCAPGYRHSPANGGPFMRCIACDCNGHASICDSETGLCICEHNTAGDNCELCAKGFYGNAITGKPEDCHPCPCPGNSACIQMVDQTIVCTECPTGYAGTKCELCSDGYFGDPAGRFGDPSPCQQCDCNLNIDPNAVGNCNRTTGECLKCIYNTAGEHCDRCLNGYYGDALAPTKGDCRPCECYEVGTLESESGPPQCDQLTGNCACRVNVAGRNCDKCQDGFFNILSGDGCESCECNLEGSYNGTCHIASGQCHCKPGTDGKHCDTCRQFHYGFSMEGCKDCDCDETGSTNYQCDINGQCPCQENVEGRRCDRCMENKQRRQDYTGCEDCPSCYNLVQDAVNQHRSDLNELGEMLSKISVTPTVVENSSFDTQLEQVKADIEDLLKETQNILGVSSPGGGDMAENGNGKPTVERLRTLAESLDTVRATLDEMEKSTKTTAEATEQSRVNISLADGTIETAQKELGSALDFLNNEGASALAKAQNKSDQFGQQSTQMSEIAQNSRLLADKLESEAKNIKEIAEKAHNTSMEAYNLAKDGITKQTNIGTELQVLANEMSAAKGKLSSMKEMVDQALKRAETVNDEALDLYAKVNGTVVPKINATSLQEQAADISAKTDELKAQIDKVEEENRLSLDEAEQKMLEGRKLLDIGRDKQDELQDMLRQLEKIYETAQNAVNQTNNTLQGAYAIHETLQNFSDQVQAAVKSRQQAESASLQIPAIREQVAEAEELINSLSEELMKAANVTKLAHDIALQTKNESAAEAAKEAHDIREKASATQTEAAKLLDEANKLSGRVSETARQIEDLEKTVEDQTQQTNDAKIKVGQANTDASEAEKQVNKSLDDLRIIKEELKNLPTLDDKALDALEDNLKAVEEELQVTNLSEKIEKLELAKNNHLKWLKNYHDEHDQLQEEVNNIKDILDMLPKGCFKKVILEPS